jgi:hypothetical protein
LYISTVSKLLDIASPYPPLPFINKDASTDFGWAGSKGFMDAANKAKDLTTKKLSVIPEAAASMVGLEIETFTSESVTFDHTVEILDKLARIDECKDNCLLSSSSSSSSSSSGSILQEVTSATMPSSSSAISAASISNEITSGTVSASTTPFKRRNKPKGEKKGITESNTTHSNKGSVGSHKVDLNKNSLTMKV